MNRGLRILLLALGLGLFGFFIHNAGVDQIANAFKGLGWWAAVVLVPYATVFSIDTLGWRHTFTREVAEKVSYRAMWYVRLAGEAVNNMIPSLYVGGEAAKVYLLNKRGVPVVNSTAAAVRSKTAQSVAQSTFIAMGALIAAMALPAEQVVAKYIFGGMAACGFVVMALLFKLQARGMFMTLLGWVRRLGLRLRSLDAREDGLRRMDEAISSFYTQSRRRFVKCTLLYLVGWVFDTFEILLVSYALGTPVSFHEALVIEAFIGVAKGFNTVVPGAFGVQEFSVMALFMMFGLPKELGVQYAIIRRGRDLAFTALGWGFLYHSEASLRGLTERVRSEAEEMESVADAARAERLED
tara:strand:- start:191 stop:1252 length:1062 start_codon:yes stop_codon:yes gene_type:complete